MAEVLEGKVTRVKAEPREGKYGPMLQYGLTIDGVEAGVFLNVNAELPDIKQGDYVSVDVQPVEGQKGTYLKIIKNGQDVQVRKLGEEVKESKVTTSLKDKIKTNATGSTTTSRTTTTHQSGVTKAIQTQGQATSKDISMEVSGLLQAIINKHGLTENAESQLREALQLKRKVATELEQMGTV